MNGLQITYYLKGEDITKNVFFAGERPEIFSLTQKKCVNDYQYAYTDHLGNVRMIYTSNPGETTFAANMEAAPNEADDEFFDGTNNTPDVLATSGTSVTRLMAGQVSGPALTALPVYPGDTIAMQVQGFYRGGSGTSTVDIPTLIAAVAGSFGGLNGGTTAEQTIFNAFDQAINPALGGFGIQTTETGEVAAYLNYIMFDKNMQMVQHGHWPMDDDALANPMLIKMEPAPVAKEEGFIYVYLTNESDSEIYFDDFEVTLKESLVVQSNNYYPFGLVTSDSWTRPTDLKNNFLYNAGSELNEETQNYETFYRQYDAAIGRFTAVDIMASSFASITPYNYAFNDPISLNDPNGDCPSCYTDHEGNVWNFNSGGLVRNMGPERDGIGNNSIRPGSGNHWGDQYRSVDANSVLMGMRTFRQFYGIDRMNDQEKAEFVIRVGASVDLHVSDSDLSKDPTVYNTGAKNTAWIFDGKLIDVTTGGTLVWGDYYGDPHIIGGFSVASKNYLLGYGPNREPYRDLWGNLDYFLNGGYENGIQYNKDGIAVGVAPVMGVGPDVGAGGSAKRIVKSLKSIRNLPKTAKNVWGLVKNSGFSDWYRTGQTVVSNQLVHGAGSTGASVAWGIKGGGKLAKTGQSMGFHYHIHKFNWYRPWTWFKHTPIIKP